MKFSSDVVIGLEIHAELDTETKLFCSCPSQGNESPNTRVCPVCLGHPGSKPVANRKALEYAVMLASALDCRLAEQVIFSRKSYFYPDMAKNYQITQYEIPIGKKGCLHLGPKKVCITRVHLEEDPASLIHPGGIGKANFVLVDYNRSGNPLCEIVTEPELCSPKEAREFMKGLIAILEYLHIFKPGKNIIKADANVSVKETGYTRVEIKNISGFKEIERALEYEVRRQNQSPNEVCHETRSWDAGKGITVSLRKKEAEEDYGYITDPDLVPINLTEKWISQLMKNIPELPQQKKERYVKSLNISSEDAAAISSEPALASMFENAIKQVEPILAAKWIRRELVRVLNYNKIEPSGMKINEGQFIMLLQVLQARKITEKVAQRVIEKLAVEDVDVKKYVSEQGLEAGSGSLEKFCQEALEENPKVVEDFKSGREVAINFLIGQVMKKTKGKAEPKDIKESLLGLII